MISIIKKKSFSEIFPYVGVHEGMLLSVDPMSVTGVAEVYLSNVNDLDVMQGRHDRLMELFCSSFEGMEVSIYYCKSFFPANPRRVQQVKSDLVNYMEENKIDYVSAHLSPEYTVYIAITIPVVESKDNKVLEMFNNAAKNEKSKKNVKEQGISGLTEGMLSAYKVMSKELDVAFNSIRTNTRSTVIRLKSGELLNFLSKIVNHCYVPRVNDISDVILSDWNSYVPGLFSVGGKFGYVYYNDNYHIVLSLRASQKESKLPMATNAAMNNIFLNHDLYGIPFIVHHHISVASKADGLAKANRRLSMISNREGFAKYLKFFEKTPEGLPPEKLRYIVEEAIGLVESTPSRFVDQFFHVHLWDKSLDALEKRYKTFDATVKMTYKMKREQFNIKGAYFSVFPGNEGVEKIRTMLLSDNVTDFMPIDLPRLPYFDDRNDWELYYYNATDSFCKIDLFDKRCSNYNAVVAGASGSGKSFSEQDKLWQAMKYDPCVAIIDFGGEGAGSYMSFVKNLGGTYLEINLNKPVSLNPFAGRYFVWQRVDEHTGEVVEERDAVVSEDENGVKILEEGGVPDGLKHSTLMATLERMFKGKRQDIELPPKIKAEVVALLRKYYLDERNNADNTCNLEDFAERCLKDRFTGDWDLYARLMEFIGQGGNQGTYARFFKGTRKIENDDIICFDMAGLSAHTELKAVLIPALISMITQNILNNPNKRHRKKLIIMDEAWRELQGGDMAQFMEEMFRTVRKLNGQVTIITQSIDDLLGSSSINALMNNTSYFWFIGGTHNAASLREVKAQGVGLSEYDISVITSQQNKRDIYLLSPFFSGQLRFYPTPEFVMLATTDPVHRTVIDKVRKEVGVDYTSPEVIRRLQGHPLFQMGHHVTKGR